MSSFTPKALSPCIESLITALCLGLHRQMVRTPLSLHPHQLDIHQSHCKTTSVIASHRVHSYITRGIPTRCASQILKMQEYIGFDKNVYICTGVEFSPSFHSELVDRSSSQHAEISPSPPRRLWSPLHQSSPQRIVQLHRQPPPNRPQNSRCGYRKPPARQTLEQLLVHHGSIIRRLKPYDKN